MPDGEGRPSSSWAHLVDDAEMTVRVFRRGTRQLGESCKMTVALNGEERLSFDEDAGDRAPRELVIDICTRAGEAETILLALTSRPWLDPDGPVIIFTRPEEDNRIAYLVRNAEISRILDVMRDALDIELGIALEQDEDEVGETRLDAAAARG